MNKYILYYSVFPIVIFVAMYVTMNTKEELDLCYYSAENTGLVYTVSNDILTYEEQNISPLLGKSFLGFKEALAFKESRGNYFVVNTLGYLGKYQFGKGTLNIIGIYNTQAFLNSPELQEKAFIANAQRNKWILRRDIKQFVGKIIDGILVTESGILAAAHLAGPGNVKSYLRSYGAVGFADAYGTSIPSYMKRFSDYDTTSIIGNKKAKASLL